MVGIGVSPVKADRSNDLVLGKPATLVKDASDR